jgi:hypothetical protein
VDGTNVLTRISDAISTAFTNFSATAKTWSGYNVFSNEVVFERPNSNGAFISINSSGNGILKCGGLTDPATGADTGVLQVSGGIASNSQSYFNGIIMPNNSYVKIGDNILNGTSISYINGSSFQSGQVIQMRSFNPENSTLDNSTSFNGQNIVIFSKIIRSRSNNSQIYVTFDCDCRVNGGGLDYWGSYLNIFNSDTQNLKTVGAKYMNVNSDTRNSSLNLFPLSGSRLNFQTNHNYSCNIGVYGDSDDNLTITEVQN